jgi:hypothetical protein
MIIQGAEIALEEFAPRFQRAMSIRENIELYGFGGLDDYRRILVEEFGAKEHPAQPGALMLEGFPFYSPRQAEDHVSILSFNKVPLPFGLVTALITHPELFPDEIVIRWIQEQELIFECTLGVLRSQDEENEKPGKARGGDA